MSIRKMENWLAFVMEYDLLFSNMVYSKLTLTTKRSIHCYNRTCFTSSRDDENESLGFIMALDLILRLHKKQWI